MNIYMTRLAFGAKCGGLTASGLKLRLGLAVAKRFSFNSEARATPPMPQADLPKNCRRVIACKRRCCSWVVASIIFISVLTLRNCFVQIQQHIGHDRPGRQAF